ncbi:hypothetical protein ACH5RR_029345 [Cinchona calisaya]|uniref:Uncharacterized protein n=1 Tax=Cinchona calisaya TaxID=153742 RepID=A0ABD2YT13_9GENT
MELGFSLPSKCYIIVNLSRRLIIALQIVHWLVKSGLSLQQSVASQSHKYPLCFTGYNHDGYFPHHPPKAKQKIFVKWVDSSNKGNSILAYTVDNATARINDLRLQLKRSTTKQPVVIR